MKTLEQQDANEARSFRNVLLRNIVLPLALSVASAALFVTLVIYLLDTSRLVEKSERIIGQANASLKLLIDSETGLRGYLLTGDEEFLEPRKMAQAEFYNQLLALKKMVEGDVDQVARLERVRARFVEWENFASRIQRLRYENADYLKPVKEKIGKKLVDEIRNTFSEFVEVEARLRDARKAASESTARWTLILGVLGSLLVGLFLALFGRKQLSDLSTRFNASLQKSRDQNAALEEQNWLQTSQSGLSDVVRGEQSVSELSQNALNYLCDYTSAQVGRVFVLDGRNRLMECAGYAYDERAGGSKTYVFGQGAVGQCGLERKIIALAALPADYLKVSSGLGAASPKFVILAPLEIDETLKGVIELGFLQAPPSAISELLKRSSEKLGSAIQSAQGRVKLQELLEETQRQAEELQSQQEELESTNEDLQQKSQELLAQQHNLEQNNSELEQQQALLEEQKEKLEESNAELFRAQEETKEKARNLETASRYKSEFLANMSHELRTPLNSVLLLSNLLVENPKQNLDAEDVEYASTIHSSASDLLNLINDILDLSKVEAGKLELTPETTSFKALAERLERTFRPQMAKKGLAFHITAAEGAPESISTDKTRCEQILRNFLSNSLKFTEKGSVTLEIRRPTREEGDFKVAIAVEDSGIGIAPDKQKLVFEAFQQADGTISRRFGGTGLGLTIARELARLLGGVIRLKSDPGTGTTLTLLLPETVPASAAPPAAEPVAPPSSEIRRERRNAPEFQDDRDGLLPGDKAILVVEDDPVFAKIVSALCKRKGFKCLLAPDGEAGLHDATTFLPMAIILDVNLPGVSGIGVLERLKQSPATRHIPVHVLSAEDRSQQVLRMGAIGFAVKPADKEELEAVFAKVLEKGQSSRLKRVLVIEDNKLEQDNIRRIIGNGDVVTVVVGTGTEAFEQLAQENFDCAILDLKLPDMSGFDLLKKVEETGLHCPPIIVYTARDLTKEERARLAESSRSIVLKGVRSPERLLDEVTLFVHKMEGQLSRTQKEMLQKVRHREEVFQDKKALLVDDDMRNIFALRSVLLRNGFQIVAAKTGREALERLAEEPDISVILMDIMMPEMDGIEAIKAIRQEPRFKNTPIIALTAKAMKGDRERCLVAGASDYLPKPVDINSLLSLLRIWLTK